MHTHSLYSSSSPFKKSSLLDNNNINIKLINTAISPSKRDNTPTPTAKTNNTPLQHNKHINNDNDNNNINNNNNKYLKKKTLPKDTTSSAFDSTPTPFKPSLHSYDLPSSYTISTPEDLHFLYVHLIHTANSLETTF